MFVLIAFLARFLKILGSGSKEMDYKIVDSKIVYNKNIGSGKASSKKVIGFLADFILSLLLLFIKSYKNHFSIYFLKLY